MHAGIAEVLSMEQIASRFGLRKMGNADAHVGIVTGFTADNEVQPAPGGFDGLKARVMQETAHAFADCGVALRIR
jgi:hypothetical protein